MTGDAQGEGERGRERPGPRFDPVAGVRALADIQAEGLRAAGELLERVLGSEPDHARPPSRSAGADYGALVDAWTDLLRRTLAALAQAGQQPGAVTISVESSGVGPPVRLATGGAHDADGAVTEIWLHNGTFSAVGPLTLRCGQLTDAAGSVLEGAEVLFEPRDVGMLEPRSSRAVEVTLASNGSPRPGTYRGTVQAQGAPRLWLPIEVEIEAC